MLGIEHELLFLCSECASVLSCIFVVKVEGAHQFLCGGKLFSNSHFVCVKTQYSDAKVIRGRARNQGVDKDFEMQFPIICKRRPYMQRLREECCDRNTIISGVFWCQNEQHNSGHTEHNTHVFAKKAVKIKNCENISRISLPKTLGSSQDRHSASSIA